MVPLPRAILFTRVFRARAASGRQPFNRVVRRHYASDHANGSSGGGMLQGDLPWMLGAVSVTVPSTYYLLQLGPNTSHVHGHEETAEHQEGEEQEESKSDLVHKDDAGKGQGAENEVGKDEEDNSEGNATLKQESAEGNDEKVSTAASEKSDHDKRLEKEKGTKEDPNVNDSRDDNNVKKTYKDAKGGAKARLESQNAVKQGGKGDSPGQSANVSAGDQNSSTVGAQAGISNTDTKHSVDYQNHPEKSSKGEGDTETAKVQGPVDPKRPQK